MIASGGARSLRDALAWLVNRLVPHGGLAYAHSGTQSYVFARVEGGHITGSVQFPIADLNEILGVEIPQTDADPDLARDSERIQRYAADHISIRDASGAWTLDFIGFRALENQRGSYVILDYVVLEPPVPLPRDVTVTYDGIIEAMPAREALVMFETDSPWERYRTALDRSLVYRAGSSSHRVSLSGPDWRTGVAAAVRYEWRRARRYAARLARRSGLRPR